MNELIEVCQKFKDGTCSIDELYRRLSWIAVPNQFSEVVSRTEKELEFIHFTELEENWGGKALEVINKLFKEIGYNELNEK
ncbi:hypothetical protein ACFPYJ_10465 [Paenibacillus solisilvae]|uniref:Uncharacterized protein n=1 Tax=Paenibacillus solisilvae TaxID=2486751 RepID=A0ABW0VXX8_9BACL